MSLIKHKKQLYFASLIVAFILVLQGIDNLFLLPFARTLTLDHPAAYGYDKNSMMIVDKQSRRLIRLDEKGRVVAVSDVSTLPNIPTVIKDICVYIDEMYIMGCDMYNDGSHIANERIEHYTLDGKYLGNVYSEYLPESVFRNRQSLYSMTVSGGELFVTRAKHNAFGVDVYNLSDMQNVGVTSVKNDVPVMAAYYDADGKRLAYADIYNKVYIKEADKPVIPAFEAEFFQGRPTHSAVALKAFKKNIKLIGEVPLSDVSYKILYDDGCGLPVEAHFLRKHTELYGMDFTDGKVVEMKTLPLAPSLLLYQLLYVTAFVWLLAAFAKMLFKILKNGLYEGLGICVASLLICMAVIGMNSYSIYQTLERECLEKLEAISNILIYDVENIHSDMFKKFDEQGIADYCKSYTNKNTIASLSDRTTSLIDAFGQMNGFYGYIMAYERNGILYTLTDSQNEYPTGFHFGMDTSAKYRALLEKRVSREKDYRGKCICYRSEISSEGTDGTSVVIEVGCYTGALLKKSIVASARGFFDKYSIFLMLWLSGLIISLLRKDIAVYRKLKNSADSAFANIPFTRVNTVLLGFLLGLDEIMFLVAVRAMYPMETISSLAILTATPMVLHILSAIVSNNIIPFVRRYCYDRHIGCFSAVFSACGYLLLAVAVTTKNYLFLCIGKTLVGFFLAGTLNFMIHTVLSCPGGDAVRKQYTNSYYNSKTIGTLLGIMASGYLVTYWSFKGLYLFASAVSLLLFVAAIAVFPKEGYIERGIDTLKMQIAVNALKSKDVLLYFFCILIPAFAALGFNEYLFPLYATIYDYSPLLISNIVAFVTGMEYLSSKAIGKVTLRYDDKNIMFYAMFLLGISGVCVLLHTSIVFVALLLFMVTVAMSLVATGGSRYFRTIMQNQNVPNEIGTQLYAQLRSFSHIAGVIPLYIVSFSSRYAIVVTGVLTIILSLLFIKRSGSGAEVNVQQ